MTPVFILILVGTDPCVCPDLPKASAELPMPFACAGRTRGFAPTLVLVVTEVCA
ncbi:MAG: hypothetical protein RLZZ156_2163 [Deinococcota bacterium]|jgi:hypothetical protein